MTSPAAIHVLLIGGGQLAEASARVLEAAGAEVHRLDEPDDAEIREALDDRIDRVVVISRYDHVSLRRALTVAHVRPDGRQAFPIGEQMYLVGDDGRIEPFTRV